MRILEQIHKKDKEKKAQFSLAVAGGITSIIALVWITTLPARFGETISLSDIGTEEGQSTEVAEKEGIGSFISDTKSQLGNIFESNKDAIQEEKQALDDKSSLGQLSAQEQQASVINGVPEGTMNLDTASTTINTFPEQKTTEYAPESTTTPTPIAPRIILIGTTSSHSSE